MTTNTGTATVAQLCSAHVNEYFKKKPYKPFSLEDFNPVTGSLLGGLLKTPIPRKPSSKKEVRVVPSLLLYDLKPHPVSSHPKNVKRQKKETYQHIQNTLHRCRGLYGTSGAGKTRSVYEYLSSNFGFYFLGKDSKDPGSYDLLTVINWFGQNHTLLPEQVSPHEFDSQLSEDEKKRQLSAARKDKSENHHMAMDGYIMIMIYVRVLIFNSIKEQLKKGKYPALTAYDWLLIQLFPRQAMGSDLFDKYCGFCLAWAKERPTDTSVYSYIFERYHEKVWPWSVMVVDEAQELLRRLPNFFLDKHGKKKRYAFSAVLKSMNKLLSETIRTETGYPLVAGTGMSLDALKEAEGSILGKDPVDNTEPQESIYKRFEPLNSEAVKEYLLTFLELDLQEEQNKRVSNAAVIEHLAKWLRGRPRWSASFVELYLVQKYNDKHDGTRGSFSDEGRLLIQALDRFIANYTNDKLEDIRDSGDRKKSYDPPEGTAYSAVKDAFLMGEHRLVKNLEQAIFKFATSGKEMFIEQDIADLIEVGVAALSSGSKAVIDEPLIVQAGVNYMSLDEAALENMIFQEEGGLGEAFEKVVLPAIQRKFGSVLEKQVGSAGVSWEDYAVPLRSAYGVIGLACAEIEETLEWINNATGSIFEGQVPPFCFPDTNIGPDLMFLLWNKDYTEYIVVIAQAKYKKELKNQMDALRMITPSLLYFDKRGKAKQKPSAALDVGSRKDLWEAAKPKLVGTKHGCVRFMVQYPCGQTGSATPGLLEDDEVSVGEKARKENKKSTTEERPAKKKKITDNKKLGFLTCISVINATDMFTKKGVEVLKALKGKD